jgi:hypothetical protein
MPERRTAPTSPAPPQSGGSPPSPPVKGWRGRNWAFASYPALCLLAAGIAHAQPAPLGPPTGSVPAPAPNYAPSPILTQPGPVFVPQRAPAPAAPAGPSSIDQQKTQSYRSGLQQQQRDLERQGVSPANERSREIQQELNPPGR